MSMYTRRPAGFRAVRMRGKTEVVYCIGKESRTKMSGMNKQELHGDTDVYAPGEPTKTLTKAEFAAIYAVEHAPMPPAVAALFEGKPTFAQWWDERAEQK